MSSPTFTPSAPPPALSSMLLVVLVALLLPSSPRSSLAFANNILDADTTAPATATMTTRRAATAAEELGAQPQQQRETCGAYKGATCDNIWMSDVLGEKGSAFAVKMSVAAVLGMFIGIQREFGEVKPPGSKVAGGSKIFI